MNNSESAGPGQAYQFTNGWFAQNQHIWDQLVPQIDPAKILEIGSYEGASACYLIDKLSPRKSIELHCVDSWEGGVEHQHDGTAPADMSAVERRFHENTTLAIQRAAFKVELVLHKGYSDVQLARLLAGGKRNYFDLVYVDGSHQAPDVLADAVLAFRLTRPQGLIIFDDYLWSEGVGEAMDPIRCPKPAIDAFTALYCRKIRIITAPLGQLYVQKMTD